MIRPPTRTSLFPYTTLFRSFVDRLALLIKAIALAGGAVLVLLSWNEVPDRHAAEYHACLLIIVAGLCLTGSANELVPDRKSTRLNSSHSQISLPAFFLKK